MKILAFSGAHGNRQVTEAFLDRVGEMEARPDIYISAGDLGPLSMLGILTNLSEHGVPVLYVHGNHILHHPGSVVELCLQKIRKLPGVHHIGDSTFEHLGWSFIGQDALTDFTDDKNDPGRYHDPVS